MAKLKSPAHVQEYLDGLLYDKEPAGPRCRSPRLVLRDRVAHCMQGASLAAAAFAFHGRPPLILSLEAVRDDDHVIALYRERGLWGAVAKSNYAGLRMRSPVYRSLRELALSYFEHYYNERGEKTLRGYSRPVSLSRFDARGWQTADEDIWYVAEHLCEIPHTPLLPAGAPRYRMDRRLYEAGRLGGLAK